MVAEECKTLLVSPVSVAGNTKICLHLNKVLPSQVCRTKSKEADKILSECLYITSPVLLAHRVLEAIPNSV